MPSRQNSKGSHKIPFISSCGWRSTFSPLFLYSSSIFSSHSQITRNPFVRVNALVENAEKEIIWPFAGAKEAGITKKKRSERRRLPANGRGQCHMCKIWRIFPIYPRCKCNRNIDAPLVGHDALSLPIALREAERNGQLQWWWSTAMALWRDHAKKTKNHMPAPDDDAK